MNKKNNDDTNWLDDLLTSSDYGEDAIRDIAGEVEDLEFERILREAKSSKWDPEDELTADIDEDSLLEEIKGELSEDPAAEAPEEELSAEELADIPEPPIVLNPVITAPPPRPAFEDPEIAATVNLEDDEEDYLEDEEEEEYYEEEPEEEYYDDPDRKVRPKRKNGYGLFGLPHLASVFIWVAIVAVCGLSLGRLLWICATDVLALGWEDRVTTITITASDVGNVDAIADKLYNAGLIKYRELFRFYASLSSADEKISAGTFELNTKFDYNALVKGMSATSSYRESKRVTIPEGYTCAQIFDLLEKEGICSAAELKAYRVQSDYWFLEGSNTSAEYPLEGFLFPDTYNFYIGDTPQGVFRRLLARYDEMLTDELKEYVQTSKYSLYEIMIIASMIEKESAGSSENYDISSVIYNRLNNADEFPFLDIDATIVYAQGGKNDVIDKELDSPYNTYKYKGLPPTPICNPSLLSIQAALAPTETKYYFYALDPSTGLHHFSKTYKEHQDFLNSLK
ncbi:MAG: endolytic transglycosylase MltG [Ruminococcaceae bacterium]|nr:endolytic transglycosylase MltG [Oscillospiraceae bacterium]